MRYLATFLLSFIVNIGLSQQEEPLFVHYNSRQGLAGDQVTSIIQDKSGFLWIGTQTGLSKFDGKDFVNFNSRTPQLQLTVDHVTDLELDSQGRIWALTTDGINIINPENREVQRFRFPENELPGPDSWCMKAQSIGNRMIVTRESLGFVIFNISDLSYEDYYLNAYDEASETHWNNILQDIHIEIAADTVIWFSGRTLVKYNLGSHTYERIANDAVSQSMRIQFKADDGRFWLGTWGAGIFRFDPVTGVFEQFEPEFEDSDELYEGINLQLLRRDECSMWYTSLERHVGIFNHCTGQFIEFESLPEWYYSLKAEASRVLFEDRAGRVWIGSAQGLACVDPSLQQFSNIKGKDFDEISSVMGHWTFPVANGRYFHADRSRQTFFRAKDSGEITAVKPFGKKVNYSGAFRYDHKIHVFGRSGILELDTVNHELHQGHLRLPGELADRIVNDVVMGGNGNLFASIRGEGLYCYFKEDEQWRQLDFEASGRIFNLHVWSDSLLFITTSTTAYTYDLNSALVTPLEDLLVTPTVYGFDDVVAIKEDLKGRLWLSSDRYPTRILERDYSWQYFADSVIIADFYFDAEGHGYLVSNQGFGVVDTEEMTLELFGQQEGLNSQVLRNSWSSYIGEYDEGKIIFGTLYGWQVYNPNHRFEEVDFSLYLKDATWDGNEAIKLDHDYSQLGFEVGIISFSQRHKAQLRYRLNPDLDWIPLSDDGRINLPRLGSGSYQLEIAGVNAGGKELRLTPISIKVSPPFWKTAWFIIAVALLGSGILVLLFRQRSRRVNAKVKLQKEVMESELKSLQAQMNPHFIFNSLNSIKSLIQEQEGDAAIQYLTTFSQLVRGILNASSHQLIPLEQDIAMMEKYIKLESLRFSDSFTFSLDNQLEHESEDLLVPPLLCQIYLENAIWHGLMQKTGERNLSMTVEEEGERMVICIEDNGIGRQKALELKSKSALKEKSVGLELAKSRLESLSQILKEDIEIEVSDLNDVQGNPSGTRVKINLPKMYHFA